MVRTAASASSNLCIMSRPIVPALQPMFTIPWGPVSMTLVVGIRWSTRAGICFVYNSSGLTHEPILFLTTRQEAVDLPDLGPTAVAEYCDVTGHWSHVEILVGAKDCSASKDDDSIIFKQNIAFHSGKCIPSQGLSIVVECILGPCPGKVIGIDKEGFGALQARRGLSESWADTALMMYRIARYNQ
jgi:hypothetical protein